MDNKVDLKSRFGIAEIVRLDMVIRSDLARMELWTKDINLPGTKFDKGNWTTSQDTLIPNITLIVFLIQAKRH